MRHARAHLGFVLAVAMLDGGGGASAQPFSFADNRADAATRRTDGPASLPFNLPVGRTLPDILGLNLSAWLPDAPASDPYTGRPPFANEPHEFVRVEAHFAGLLNPPGPLGGPGTFNPNLYGISPLYLFLDLDVDNDPDTGGELGPDVLSGYTANAARFGSMPTAPLTTRTALAGIFVDTDFNTIPQIERTGADWTLALCGCEPLTIVQHLAGDADPRFEANEDWIIAGRFFRRAGGYREGSSVFGGSQLGAYDPVVNLRFRHTTGLPGDGPTGRTIITLVYPLTMKGAALLRGGDASGPPPGGPEPIDFDASNDTSIAEGLADLVFGANSDALKGPNLVLQSRWAGRTGTLYANPSLWRPTAIAATAYPDTRQPPFIYTDIAFSETLGDVTGNAVADVNDQVDIYTLITNFDGTTFDADASVNGVVAITNYGPNFVAHDIDNNGRVDLADVYHRAFAPPCPADLNSDGLVDTADLVTFLGRFGTTTTPWGTGDLTGDGAVNTADLTAFLARFGQGC